MEKKEKEEKEKEKEKKAPIPFHLEESLTIHQQKGHAGHLQACLIIALRWVMLFIFFW